MAHYVAVFVYYDLQPLLEQVALYGWFTAQEIEDYPPPLVADYGGYRAVVMSDTIGEDTVEINLVFAPLAATETMPARSMLTRPGFDSNIKEEFWNTGEFPGTWDDMVEFWEVFYVDLKAEILEEWGNAFVEVLPTFEIDSFGGAIRSACAVIQVTTDLEVMVSVSSLSGVEFNDAEFLIYRLAQPSTIAGVGNSAVSINPATLDAIAQGVSDLAHTTVTMSLNNGGAIASLQGAEIITT